MRRTTLMIACVGLVALSAQAQVHRCKDATGKIIYTDQPCVTGQYGVQIERQRSQAEIQQEREQAYDAEIRKQERRLAEQERAFIQQQNASQQPIRPNYNQPTESWQDRKNRENAATSAGSITNNGGRWDAQAEALRREEAKRRAAAAPPIITHCDPGFCYDDKGGVYHKAGPNFLTGPNGRACHGSGTTWQCS